MNTITIIIIVVICLSIISSIVAFFMFSKTPATTTKERVPCNSMSFEYGSDTAGIQKISSLPATIENAYCVTIPLQDDKTFKIEGKACSTNNICNDILIKSTPAYNITYTDKLLNGTINYV
jgi:hypothetical protein